MRAFLEAAALMLVRPRESIDVRDCVLR